MAFIQCNLFAENHWTLLYCLVTGDANFVMENTGLTIGGFTQPAVARALIETPSNIEKGLSTRFLWIFLKPCYSKFSSFEPVKEKFTDALGNLNFLIVLYYITTISMYNLL